MKKMKYLAVLFISVMAFSCSDDDSDDDSGPLPTDSSSLVTTGDWEITNFTDDGNNETSHFSGYTFTFSSSGTLEASNGNVNQSGSWSLGNDDSQHKLIITMNSEADPWEELTEDWEIISITSSKIDLKHVSGGNGGIDTLLFEKN